MAKDFFFFFFKLISITTHGTISSVPNIFAQGLGKEYVREVGKFSTIYFRKTHKTQ
jgi:hypothetical protein